MTFFTTQEVRSLQDSAAEDTGTLSDRTLLQTIHKKMNELHERVSGQFPMHNLDLHLLDANSPVSFRSVATVNASGVLSLQYLRSPSQALTVERLMGREEVATLKNLAAQRHPVIEIRLMPEKLALEFILSPDAWYDQQNLAGKITVPRHRQTFYGLLRQFKSTYRMGFWQGTHLSNMHLTAAQFQHPRIMKEWMSTFEPTFDWFRLGVWYDLDDDLLTSESIVKELIEQIKVIYDVYEFFLWTSDNNFRDFYETT